MAEFQHFVSLGAIDVGPHRLIAPDAKFTTCGALDVSVWDSLDDEAQAKLLERWARDAGLKKGDRKHFAFILDSTNPHYRRGGQVYPFGKPE